MTVISVDKDLDDLTLTLVAVEEHDLVPGGEVTYFMTGPDGQKYRSWYDQGSWLGGDRSTG